MAAQALALAAVAALLAACGQKGALVLAKPARSAASAPSTIPTEPSTATSLSPAALPPAAAASR